MRLARYYFALLRQGYAGLALLRQGFVGLALRSSKGAKQGAILMAVLPGLAQAQTSANFSTGQTLTAQALDAAFAGKADWPLSASLLLGGANTWLANQNFTGGLQINGVTLGSTIAAGGPTGSATLVPVITFNAFGQLTAVTTAAIAPAGVTTDWLADNAGKLMVTDQIWAAGAFATITFGATTTIDLSTLINGTVTLTGNITTLNWNNCKAGQTGVIEFIQDGTGSRTVPAAWNSSFRWTGGSRGVLSTAINSVDWLLYQCKSATVAYVTLQKALAN